MWKKSIFTLSLMVVVAGVTAAFYLTNIQEEGVFLRTFNMNGEEQETIFRKLGEEIYLYSGYFVDDSRFYFLDTSENTLSLYNNSLERLWLVSTNAESIKFNNERVIFTEYGYQMQRQNRLYCYSHAGAEQWKLGFDRDNIVDVFINENDNTVYGILEGRNKNGRTNEAGEDKSSYGDYYFVKIDEMGNKIWKRVIQSDMGDESISFQEKLIVDQDGNIYLAYSTEEDGYIEKYDDKGLLLWRQKFPGCRIYDASRIDDRIYLVGEAGELFDETTPAIVICDEDGKIVNESIIDTVYGSPMAIIEGKEGNIFIINVNHLDEWEVLEYDRELNVVWGSQGEYLGAGVSGFALSKNNEVIIEEEDDPYSEGCKQGDRFKDDCKRSKTLHARLSKYDIKRNKQWEAWMGYLDETQQRINFPTEIYGIHINDDNEIMVLGAYKERDKLEYDDDDNDEGCGCF